MLIIFFKWELVKYIRAFILQTESVKQSGKYTLTRLFSHCKIAKEIKIIIEYKSEIYIR